MQLGLEQKLRLLLTPQMQQAMQVLAMNNLELASYVAELALENPAIDLELPTEAPDAADDAALERLAWLDSVDENNRGDGFAAPRDEITRPETPAPWGETLGECLRLQLLRHALSPAALRIADYLIESLDENGYLGESVAFIAKALGTGVEEVRGALGVIQRLEPHGVGARDLRECLTIQLRAQGLLGSTAYRVADAHLEDLAQNRIPHIAQCLGVSTQAVAQARALILSLDPKPGKSLSRTSAQYVYADVVIARTAGEYVPLINDERLPAIRLNAYYRRLARHSTDSGVKEYLAAKFRQAGWVIKCIESRNATLLKSAQRIIELQRRFFDGGPGELAPMTLEDVADAVGVHVSTVSRAFKGKYLQCDWGVFPFRFFLSQRLGGKEDASPAAVKALITTLIEREDRRSPESDEQLAAALGREGIDISRRTVAKYRGELGIPASTRRKQY
jgi:RNA polymerase sigma-54 factor